MKNKHCTGGKGEGGKILGDDENVRSQGLKLTPQNLQGVNRCFDFIVFFIFLFLPPKKKLIQEFNNR